MCCEVYYIVPSESQKNNCSVSSCVTLLQFVGTSHIDSNTTLFIAGGYHTLVKGISVMNISEFSILSLNNTVAIITCRDHASLSFTSVGSIHISGVKFRDCSGAQLESVQLFSIEHSVFLRENRNHTRPFLNITKSTISISNTTFLSKNAEEGKYSQATYGGALVVTHSKAKLNECRFEGNRANIGGAIFSEHQSVVTISNSNFTSNTAIDSNHGQSCLGGALFIGKGCRVVIHHSIFQNNTSDGYGGMGVIISATLLLSHSFVSGNSAQSNGREVVASQNSGFMLQIGIVPHSRINLYGGAIHSYESNVIITNCNFSENVAEYGGALSVERSNLTIDSCSFSKSIASMNGGVLVAESHCIITVTNSTFVDNKAVHDDGILSILKTCLICISNSTFRNNAVGDDGGAIMVQYSSTSIIRGCNFTKNIAKDKGGAVFGYDNTTICITSSLFDQCRANFGGSVFIENDCNLSIVSSTITSSMVRYDGAISAALRSTITIQSSIFNGNHADQDGSVITVRSHGVVTISNSLFKNNSAEGDGMLHALDDSNITMDGSIFMDNVVNNNGGVVYSHYRSNTAIDSCTFINNRASDCGGAVYGRRESNITIRNSTFKNCTAGDSGGGVYIQLSSHVAMENSNFFGNIADLGGAVGVYLRCSSYITKSIFHSNTGNTEGGALHVFKSSTVEVHSSVFKFNRAADAGVARVTLNSMLTIINSSFLSNIAERGQGGVISVLEVRSLVVTGSTFQNNVARSGGVLHCRDIGDAIIAGSVFEHNSAMCTGGVIHIIGTTFNIINISSDTFFNNTAGDSGGVMAFLDNGATAVKKCNFTRNKAGNNGGVIYIYHVSVKFSHCIFNLSEAGNNGGVAHAENCSVDFISSSFMKSQAGEVVHSKIVGGCTDCSTNTGAVIYLKEQSNCNIVDSMFAQNRASNCGGVISLITSSEVKIANSAFLNNTAKIGAVVAAMQASSILIDSVNKSHPADGRSIHIHNNVAEIAGGCIYLSDSKIHIKMNTCIGYNQAERSGGGIHAVDSSIIIASTVHFDQNKATNGGGVSLKNSMVYTTTNDGIKSHINFVSNQAVYGGALYIYDEYESDVCSNDAQHGRYSDESGCFFQNVTKHMLINFINNKATSSGYDLYGGLLDQCTVVSRSNHSQLESRGLTRFKEISNLIDLKNISSKPVQVCLCNNNQPDCSSQTHSIQVKRGDIFTLCVAAINQIGMPTNAMIQSRFQNLYMSENQTVHNIRANCSTLDFQVSFPQVEREYELAIYTKGLCSEMGIPALKVHVHVLSCSCGPGFMLTKFSTECTCICDERLSAYIKTCDSKTETLVREGNVWIKYLQNSDNDDAFPYIIYPHCPLDYCHPPSKSVNISLNLANGSDAQCTHYRSGLLCGSCQPGFSLSLGSSKCIKCVNSWYGQLVLIIIAAFLAGIILVVVHLVLNLTVAVGTINSIIFYSNIIDANKSIYFRQSHLTFVPVFISWINMDIGFDTCFFEGMDTYTKTWLQLLFPTYIIFLVIFVILLSSVSSKFSSILGMRNPVATLATLILISYTKFLQAIITVLSYATIKYPNSTTNLWLPDASVAYAKGKHFVLIIVALVIIIIGLPYTVLIFFWQCLVRCQNLKLTRNLKLHAFVDAYHTPHTAKHRYWAGLLLMVRVIIYLISAFSLSVNPRVSLLFILVIMSILILYKTVIKAYKNCILDVIDSLTFFNIAFFTTFIWFTHDDPHNENLERAVAYISVGTVILQFLLVILFHAYRYCSARVYTFGQSTRLGKIINRQISYVFDWNEIDDDSSTSSERDVYRLFDNRQESDVYNSQSQRYKPTSSSVLLEENCNSEL